MAFGYLEAVDCQALDGPAGFAKLVIPVIPCSGGGLCSNRLDLYRSEQDRAEAEVQSCRTDGTFSESRQFPRPVTAMPFACVAVSMSKLNFRALPVEPPRLQRARGCAARCLPGRPQARSAASANGGQTVSAGSGARLWWRGGGMSGEGVWRSVGPLVCICLGLQQSGCKLTFILLIAEVKSAGSWPLGVLTCA